MGILDKFLPWRGDTSAVDFFDPGALDIGALWDFQIDSLTPEDLYATQPHLRTVTSFIARMVSAVALHVYRREEDGGRVRVRPGDGSPIEADRLARLMVHSSKSQLMSQLIYRSVMDLCLYDEWIWVVAHRTGDSGVELLPIPPDWVVQWTREDVWTLSGMVIFDPHRQQNIFIPGKNIVRYAGYSPCSLHSGTPPILALKDVLKQNENRAAYQNQLWARGPRMAGFIERPSGMKWDDRERNRFKTDLRRQFAAGGSGAGGIALLEDGMSFKPHHLKASDEQLIEQVKLSLETVAQVYHINPTMVGILDNANYSNVKEFRQSLYGDSLLPVMKAIEESINAYLLPVLGVPDGYYVEFNMAERLRARFEEQAAVLSTAVGAPWMTRNEARGMQNLPRVDGGDELAEPLNTDFGDIEPPEEVESP